MLKAPFKTNWSTYKGHSGADSGQPAGTIVRAGGNGVVTRRGWINNNAGYGVIIAYDNGPVVLYCHYGSTALVPQVGSRVTVDSAIGRVGSTGRSTGPHLHMEIMNGTGAHTFDGVWRYFTTADQAAPANNNTVNTEDGKQMFIASRKGAWFLIIPVSDKLYAVAMGQQDVIKNVPYIEFNWDVSWNMLKSNIINAQSVPA